MKTFYTANVYDDFEHYAESVKTWDLDFMQLSPGKLHADMLLFGDMELQIAINNSAKYRTLSRVRWDHIWLY